MAPLREGPLLRLHSFLYQCLVVGVCLFDIKRKPLVWELAWGSVKSYSKSMVDRCVLLCVGSWYCFQVFLLSGVMSLQEISWYIKAAKIKAVSKTWQNREISPEGAEFNFFVSKIKCYSLTKLHVNDWLNKLSRACSWHWLWRWSPGVPHAGGPPQIFSFFFFNFVQGLSSCVFRTCAAFPFERDWHIFKLWTGFHQMTKKLFSFTFYYFWKT